MVVRMSQLSLLLSLAMDPPQPLLRLCRNLVLHKCQPPQEVVVVVVAEEGTAEIVETAEVSIIIVAIKTIKARIIQHSRYLENWYLGAGLDLEASDF